MNKGDIFKIKQDTHSIKTLMGNTRLGVSQVVEILMENLKCYSVSRLYGSGYIIFIYKDKTYLIPESITELVTNTRIGHPLTKVFK